MKRKNTHRLITLIFCVLCLFFLTGCNIEVDPNYVPPEQPHLYWKDIEVVVEGVDKDQWYASGNHYKAQIRVYSEEYNLRKSFEYTGYEALNYWNVNIGDTVTAELYSWVMDSTGEVTRRDIHKVY